MDSEYLQAARYKLQKRYRRLCSASERNALYFALRQTWQFLRSSALFSGILEDMAARHPEGEESGQKTIDGNPQAGENEAEHNCICYWVLKKTVEAADSNISMNIGLRLGARDADVALDRFRDMYVDPFFDCLDESLDDQRSVVALLKKFKQRTEWFRRSEAAETYSKDTARGEDSLARALYEYLHDQGVEFSIEERSGSGRPDLVSSQSGPDRLIADAKIFDPDRGKDLSYLRKGFNQIYQYTNDYNETFGYLVIFKACEADLSVATDNQESSVPLVCHNNKTIFILVIDIFPHIKSASKRGKLKSYALVQDTLVESSNENGTEQDAAEQPATLGESD